ncbi:MAG: hypothetical protein KAS88_00380 [Deltaproteobacteria bacterium]|nr:hypothetical protein [Deltaproteobacteria bacterium]
MDKAKVVDRVVGRIYKEKLKSGATLPSGKEVKEMKRRVVSAAEKVDRRRDRV